MYGDQSNPPLQGAYPIVICCSLLLCWFHVLHHLNRSSLQTIRPSMFISVVLFLYICVCVSLRLPAAFFSLLLIIVFLCLFSVVFVIRSFLSSCRVSYHSPSLSHTHSLLHKHSPSPDQNFYTHSEREWEPPNPKGKLPQSIYIDTVFYIIR